MSSLKKGQSAESDRYLYMTNRNSAANQRQRIRYDAYGRPVASKKTGNRVLSFFLGFLLPYVLLNGIILFLVIAAPDIQVGDPDTKDYQTASLQFTVKSLLPLKTVTANIEGQEVELVKSGDSYSADVNTNGTMTIVVKSLNGMSDSAHVQINLLDDAAPVIDEDTVVVGAGYIEFDVSDAQSGLDFDSIYAIDGDGDNLRPTDVQKIDDKSGHFTFAMKSDSLQVYISDTANNQCSANFTTE